MQFSKVMERYFESKKKIEKHCSSKSNLAMVWTGKGLLKATDLYQLNAPRRARPFSCIYLSSFAFLFSVSKHTPLWLLSACSLQLAIQPPSEAAVLNTNKARSVTLVTYILVPKTAVLFAANASHWRQRHLTGARHSSFKSPALQKSILLLPSSPNFPLFQEAEQKLPYNLEWSKWVASGPISAWVSRIVPPLPALSYIQPQLVGLQRRELDLKEGVWVWGRYKSCC